MTAGRLPQRTGVQPMRTCGNFTKSYWLRYALYCRSTAGSALAATDVLYLCMIQLEDRKKRHTELLSRLEQDRSTQGSQSSQQVCAAIPDLHLQLVT